MAGKTYKIEELIIDMVRGNPMLYDKSSNNYHENYRSERKEQWSYISMAIYQLFEKNISGKFEDDKI